MANLQYFGIVVACLYSVWLFDDHLPLGSWVGMALIVASGVIATVLRRRGIPSMAAPTPQATQPDRDSR